MRTFIPNPHNKQPWIIHLTGPASFNLYVDPDRLLPETDPIHRQIHIGQGTFLETPATNLDKDPLFDALLLRHSNKGEYNHYRLSESELKTLIDAHQQQSEYPLTVLDSPQGTTKLAHILTEAMQIEVGNPQRDRETIEMVSVSPRPV